MFKRLDKLGTFNFAGGVSQPAEPVALAEETELPASVTTEAASTTPQEHPNLVAVAISRARCKDEQAEALADDHEAIRAEGRAQSEIVEALQVEVARANFYWNQAQTASATRRHEMLCRADERKRISRWATKAETAAADRAVQRAKALLKSALETEGETIAELNRRLYHLAEAENRLNTLAKKHEGLRLQRAGQTP